MPERAVLAHAREQHDYQARHRACSSRGLSATCRTAAPSQDHLADRVGRLAHICPRPARPRPHRRVTHGSRKEIQAPVRGLSGRSSIAGPCSPGCPTWPNRCPRPGWPRTHRRSASTANASTCMTPVRGLPGCGDAGRSRRLPCFRTGPYWWCAQLRPHHRSVLASTPPGRLILSAASPAAAPSQAHCRGSDHRQVRVCPGPVRSRPHRRTGDCKVLDEAMILVRGLSGRSPIAGLASKADRSTSTRCPRPARGPIAAPR